jgi:hypothetical protein
MERLVILLSLVLIASSGWSQQKAPEIKKVKDIVIYQDSNFYSSFPSIVKTPKGSFILAFRRAPERKIFGEKGSNHVDPNSYLVMMRSEDGTTWPKQPDLLYAHPIGGSQDPCLLQLKDGSLLCASYTWVFPRADAKFKSPYFTTGGAVFNGGYIVKSVDGGRSWSQPIYPPHLPDDITFNATSQPLPAFNRGALFEGKKGQIYWVVASIDRLSPLRNANHLLVSYDKGNTWKYMSTVAKHDSISFSETSVYETPKGDVVAFMRTEFYDDNACIARSKDGGKTFTWEKMGFKGHPLSMLRLPDNRVLLTYGYRHAPYGIRARILNAECTDYATSREFVIRDDGGTRDLGYSWPVLLSNNRALIVYYFNKNNGPRHIAGSVIEFR